MGILACSFLLLLLLMILTVLVPIGIAGILRWRIEVFKKENSKFQSIVQHLYDMQYADASDLFDTRLVCLCKNLSIGVLSGGIHALGLMGILYCLADYVQGSFGVNLHDSVELARKVYDILWIHKN